MWLECRFLDTDVDGSEPQKHQYAVSFSKTHYQRSFGRLNCEMSTRWAQHPEGCSVL